jgi:hypothetical protein
LTKCFLYQPLLGAIDARGKRVPMSWRTDKVCPAGDRAKGNFQRKNTETNQQENELLAVNIATPQRGPPNGLLLYSH